MTGCEPYQPQLLAYLYDLLEGVELRTLQEHLEQCGACRAALARAQGQKLLLARAAKTAFTKVRFQPPARETRHEPAVLRPRPAVQSRGRPTWAVAASILVLLSFGLPAAWWGVRYQFDLEQEKAQLARVEATQNQFKNLKEEHQETLRLTQHQTQELQQQLVKLDQDHLAKVNQFQQAAWQRQLYVLVTGPESIQPGAPNIFQIRTQNLQNQPVPARLAVRVLDETKKVVYEEKEAASNGTHRFEIPPTLPVRPGSQLSLEVAATTDTRSKAQGASQAAPLRQALSLAAPVYLTHLTTDKPMYQPGETVHFRSLTLERFSLKPAQDDLRLSYSITNPNNQEVFHLVGSTGLVIGPDGAMLQGPDHKPLRGLGAGDFAIPAGMAGGEYTLTVREDRNRFPEQQRKFIINQYEKPLLDKKLDFTRKSYGPGEEVVAACEASRVNGGKPSANSPVLATVQIDGKYYGADGKPGQSFALRTDEQGRVRVRFQLPAVIERGLATLAVEFHDGGRDTLVRPIPIVVKKLQVEFFPEGGDLVAGVPNRVYFQVRTMLGKPAELMGRIVDQAGEVAVADVQTLHDDKEPGVNQGMGRFAFTPRLGRTYQLKIDAPSGIEGKYELPALKNEGVVLAAVTDRKAEAAPGKEPIHLAVYSAEKDRRLLVGAYCRGRLMDHQMVLARQGEATAVLLRPPHDVGGVYRVTVFEDRAPEGQRTQLVPVAERLLYRKPVEQLIVNLKPDKKQYVPGEKVRLQFTSLDEQEQPAPAILLVSVVDRSVITLADEKTARTMPTHFFLTTEVRRPEDLEYADFLLTEHPKAAVALDLLLGTQGWRRFAEQDPGKFQKNYGQDADRLVLATGQLPRETNLFQAELEKLNTDYLTQRTQLLEQQGKVWEAWQVAQVGKDFQDQQANLAQEKEQARQARDLAIRQVEDDRALAVRARGVLLAGLSVLLLLGAVALLLIARERRASGQARPYWAMATLCLLLAGGLVLLTSTTQTESRTAYAGKVNEDKEESEGILALQAQGDQGQVQAKAQKQFEKAERLFDEAKGVKRGLDDPNQANGAVAAFNRAPAPPKPMAVEGKWKERGKEMLGVPMPAAAMPQEKFDKAAENKNLHFNFQDRAADDKKGQVEQLREGMKRADKDQDGDFRRKAEPAGRPQALAKKPIAGAPRLQDQLQARGFRQQDGFGLARDGKGKAMPRAGAQPVAPPAQPPGGFGGGFQGGGGIQGGGGFGGGGLGGMPGGGLMPALGMPGGPPAGFGGEGFGGGLGAWQAQQIQPPPAPAPLMIREYAYQRSGKATEVREDLVETVYWHPMLVLPGGKREVAFDLGDSVTTYQVLAFGHTLDGRLGAVKSTLEAKLPFSVQPTIPIEVTASDRIDIPVTIANNTRDRRTVTLQVSAQGLSLEGKDRAQLSVDPDGRARQLFRFRPTLVEGTASIHLEGHAAPFTDSMKRTFAVVPDGFPIVGSRSDVLEGVAQNEIILPESWIKGTLKCQMQVYPSTLADLQKGLDALLREPCGCFEQTSTSNYPNVLILDYLKASDQAKPEVERRARELLASGYQKLTSFECLEPSQNKRQGYEWFGGTAPPHEALTAYGLLEFRDMARVFDVDPKMVERTRQYLMARKDGRGGFQRNPRALDTFGRAPDEITNAYIVWALTESGKDDDVTLELAALAAQAQTSKDPYFLSLVATSLMNRGKAEEGCALLKTVAGVQKEDGHLDAVSTSITGSGGRDLQIETTALAVLGWLKANRPADFNPPLQKAIQWIGQQRGGYGGFGSTQSTILALKALIAYTKANKKTPQAGELTLLVGNQVVARRSFPAGIEQALVLELPEAERVLKPGKNLVRVEITGKNTFPYTLTWSYRTQKPASAANCPVQLNTRLDRTIAGEGETVHLTVTVENATDKGQGMAVAIIGLPAGLTLPEDMTQLKDDALLRNDGKEKGLIGAWETRGRELILYWRDLAPKQKIEVPLDLICRVPGEYSGPASRAYLYYNADLKHWVEPLQMSIKTKD